MLSGGSASMLETTATFEIQTSRLPIQAGELGSEEGREKA